MTKTYLTPLLREPELIIQGRNVAEHKKRLAVKFLPNSRGVGQFVTSDAKIQEHLDNHPWMAAGKMTCVSAHGDVKPTEPEVQGDQSPAPVKKGRWPKK